MNGSKFLKLNALAKKVKALKACGRTIVHCHGCFDLLHPGHIRHFRAAKKMGDILIVTLTPDKYVDKGPGRPVFNETLRAESIAAQQCVDLVAINEWPTAEETLRLVRPDVYVKGQEFDKLEDKTGKIQREAAVIKEIGAKLRFTRDIVFSSTDLLGRHFGASTIRKVLFFDELIARVRALQKKGKVVVQIHGVFDVIHPGIIQHLTAARKHGDILVATVIKDKDVRRGPGRPIFNEELRVQNVASLAQVDYVALVDEDAPYECLRALQPDIYAKGKAFQDRDLAIQGKLSAAEKELKLGKVKILETERLSFSSRQTVNNFLDVYPAETTQYLRDLTSRHSFAQITRSLNDLKKLKILLIGDGIIDEYHYCDPLGKSAKAQLVVNRYVNHEIFAGGAFAIANHLAGICGRVHLVSLLGKYESHEDFIVDNLKPGITTRFFYREDGPTIVKKRYINPYNNQKLFEVNYLNDHQITEENEAKILAYLKTEVPRYDIVLVSDFGHGYITEQIIKLIERASGKYAINTQTNGANAGYNLITKYHHPHSICVDEVELRLAAQQKHEPIEGVARRIKAAVKAAYLIVTLGKRGSLGIGRRGEVNRTPIFSTKVVDTIGAGDAFFAFTAPCFAVGMPLDLVSFLGNAVGALAVQIVGNKKPVEKYELLEFVNHLLN